MKQIQEKEAERADWPSLPERERAEAEGSFRHMSMLARYHNIMGMETISVLELLTTSITEAAIRQYINISPHLPLLSPGWLRCSTTSSRL